LKHKGTGRAMKAIMACYGVPQSMLTIMEFGGPQDPTKGGVSEFTFDDRTAALRLLSGSSVLIPWKAVGAPLEYPQSIEFMFKPDSANSFTLVSASNFSLAVTSSNTGSVLGFTMGNYYTTRSAFEFKLDNYNYVLINTTAVLVIHPNSLTDELHNKVIDAICEWVYEVTEEIPTSHSEVFARLLLAEYEYA
jgi:hypothetical protein